MKELNIILMKEKDNFIKKKIISKKKLPEGYITSKLLSNYKVGLVTIVIRKIFLNNINNVFDIKYNLLADFKFVVDFSIKHKFGCIQDPVAVYRNHSKQMSIKYFSEQVKQMKNWVISLKEESTFNKFYEVKYLDEKIKYMEIIDLIYKGKGFKEILLFPFGLKKIKLILIYFLPNFILKYFRRYT